MLEVEGKKKSIQHSIVIFSREPREVGRGQQGGGGGGIFDFGLSLGWLK